MRLSFIICFVATVIYASEAAAQKLKLCVVNGRGGFARATRTCPILDRPESLVECIVGVDRLDCLRKISKGVADFSVFTSEDLVTATNTEVEVSVTNELRFVNDSFEYEVVAVVSDASGIKSRHDLRDKRLCHPGYGYKNDWDNILANYLEASVAPQKCESSLTLMENRIKATSDFFQSACKPGPWVNSPSLDRALKQKYPNLCKICDDPLRCSMEDKYWGRRGPLFCLTENAGDVAWARLDDVRVHFGLDPGGRESSPDGYSLICPDGSRMPVNSSDACVWVVKPWSVIGAKSNKAQDVQKLMSALKEGRSSSWKSAVIDLIESFYMTIVKVEPAGAIENYLSKATGFLNANSFSGCHPPRTIHICTTSIIENFKCVWLRESAAAYGIEPDLDCIKADNKTHCMSALNDGVADVVMVPPDLVNKAMRDYNLKTLFYETAKDTEKYITKALVKHGSKMKHIQGLKGKRACFPVYDGMAWNSVVNTLVQKKLLESCSYSVAVAEFFGPSCVPNLTLNGPQKLKEQCNGAMYTGDFGAIRCLVEGRGDVAFISENSLHSFLKDPVENKGNKLALNDFEYICDDSKVCYFSWSPLSQAMVRSNSSDLWMKDTLNVFLQLDNLFGKYYSSVTLPYTLFGPFNGKSDILFHDKTDHFRTVPQASLADDMPKVYEDVLKNLTMCTSSSSTVSFNYLLLLVFYMSSLVISYIRSNYYLFK